ncbi:MAG: multidrug DMT transporter permease [Bacteroidales bacterium]|jgi:glucose uptake protein|nr:multidrug DMT transporter permease [Bacteroidales bacterium]
MVLVSNYLLGLLCCIYCCFCWGSWSNTQKLVLSSKWTAELYYWDFAIGLFLTGLLGALTLGNFGSDGESFLSNLSSMDCKSAGLALLGGAVWNFANVFLAAAIAVAGMSVAFPIGGGIGWIGGIVFNYLLVVLAGDAYPGNESLLWIGVAIIIVAILLNGKAYGQLTTSQKTTPTKGILLALASAVGLVFFYGFVVKSLDPQYVTGGTGTLTPYSGVFFFGLGALMTTPIFNGFAMRHPSNGGSPVSFRDYLAGDMRTHVVGLLGGFIWMSGMVVSFMGSSAANPAISYALSNAAPLVAIIWGTLIWKEFKGAPRSANVLIVTTFLLFILGLVFISISN